MQLYTFAGTKVENVAKDLAEIFTDPMAYKEVPGGAHLTDINTGHMLERVTKVFGLKGLGWNLLFSPENFEIKANGDEKRVLGRLKFASFVYFLYDENGTKVQEVTIPTSGANINNIEYVEEGARTSALGAALKGLCFQLPIYLKKLDHDNAGRMIDKKLEKDRKAAEAAAAAASTQSAAPASAQPTVSVPVPEPAAAAISIPEAPVPTDAPKMDEATNAPVASLAGNVAFPKAGETFTTRAPEPQVSQPAPAPSPDTTINEAETKILWAKQLVIPDGLGVPGSGKTIGEMMGGSFGAAIIRYFSGTAPKANGEKFNPVSDQQKDLAEAGRILLPLVENGKGKKK